MIAQHCMSLVASETSIMMRKRIPAQHGMDQGNVNCSVELNTAMQGASNECIHISLQTTSTVKAEDRQTWTSSHKAATERGRQLAGGEHLRCVVVSGVHGQTRIRESSETLLIRLRPHRFRLLLRPDGASPSGEEEGRGEEGRGREKGGNQSESEQQRG